MDINVKRTLNILEACNNSKVNNFVFASSIRVMEPLKDNYNYNLSSSPVFNIGTGTATSITALALKMISISGLELDPVYVEEMQDDGVISESYADMTKAKSTLHFVANKNLETGLREIAELKHISRSAS